MESCCSSSQTGTPYFIWWCQCAIHNPWYTDTAVVGLEPYMLFLCVSLTAACDRQWQDDERGLHLSLSPLAHVYPPIQALSRPPTPNCLSGANIWWAVLFKREMWSDPIGDSGLDDAVKVLCSFISISFSYLLIGLCTRWPTPVISSSNKGSSWLRAPGGGGELAPDLTCPDLAVWEHHGYCKSLLHRRS